MFVCFQMAVRLWCGSVSFKGDCRRQEYPAHLPPTPPHPPGTTLEHRDSNGDTALHHACEAGHLECVRALLARDCPSATAGTDDETIVRAILEGGNGVLCRAVSRGLFRVCFLLCW